MDNGNREGEKESCVLCGMMTATRRETPVLVRQDYIEGVGQLCPVCAMLLKLDIVTNSINGNKSQIPVAIQHMK